MKIIDDRHQYFSYCSDCAICKWFDLLDFKCDAYPDGIPERIQNRDVMHREVMPDQAGSQVYNPGSLPSKTIDSSPMRVATARDFFVGQKLYTARKEPIVLVAKGDDYGRWWGNRNDPEGGDFMVFESHKDLYRVKDD
jgi:hypothetical protein